jgi:hypothetical protein
MLVFFSHHRQTCGLIHANGRERERERDREREKVREREGGFVLKCNKLFTVILYNKVFVSAVV